MRMTPLPPTSNTVPPVGLRVRGLTPLSEKTTQPHTAPCCQHEPENTQVSDHNSTSANTYRWHISGMDCANCARKVENAVKKLPGIEQVNVLFSHELLVVKASEDIRQRVDVAVKQAGFKLSHMPSAKTETLINQLKKFRFALLLGVLWSASCALSYQQPVAGEIAYLITTLLGLLPILRQTFNDLRSGSLFTIELLMCIAALGALFIGASAEAAMVLLLFTCGERLEELAANQARRGVKALMALTPENAQRISQGSTQSVAVNTLQPGDIIEVSAGSRVPVDAQLLSAQASFDHSALTGESIPVDHQAGEIITAGSLCVEKTIQLQVTSTPGNSTLDRVLRLIEESESHRAPIERIITTFSRYYTPAIMLLATLVMILPPLLLQLDWHTWIYRGLAVLLIGCPCALVISTPAAIASALACATRHGALIKGGAALEQLAKLKILALDKTGTLTAGKPDVTDILPLNGLSQREVLQLAAAVETGSRHPLAEAIMRRAKAAGADALVADQRQTIAGVGVSGQIAGREIRVTAPQHLDSLPLTPESQQMLTRWEETGKTVVVIWDKAQILGLLALQDTLRQDAVQAIEALRQLNVRSVMLTGDNPRAAQAIARQLDIEYQASLLPEDKVNCVATLNRQAPTAMVGDGINDAPAMKAAQLGIAMGSGTDVALESADAALTHNRLSGLAEMIRMAHATHRNIRQNITLALGLKGLFLVTTLCGITGLWPAILADTGATVLVTANALRLLRKSYH